MSETVLLSTICAAMACSRSRPPQPPPTAQPPTQPRETADPDLPDKPDLAQLRAGIRQVHAQAKKCARDSETRVTAKLRIDGATGHVRDAQVLPPHDGTALGRCIAAALAPAEFTRFRSETVTVIFPVVM